MFWNHKRDPVKFPWFLTTCIFLQNLEDKSLKWRREVFLLEFKILEFKICRFKCLGSSSRASVARFSTQNRCHPVGFGFQVNNKCVLDVSMSWAVFWIHLYFRKSHIWDILTVWIKQYLGHTYTKRLTWCLSEVQIHLGVLDFLWQACRGLTFKFCLPSTVTG